MTRYAASTGLILFLLTAMMTSAASAAQIKIGVVDINTVLGQSDAGKAANASLAHLVQAKQVSLAEKQARLDQLQEQIDDPSLPADELNGKALELKRLEEDLEIQITEAQKEIDERTQEYRNLVLEDVGQVLALIAEEGGYHLIIDASSVFFYSRLVDITWEVIRRYNSLFEQANQAVQAGNG